MIMKDDEGVVVASGRFAALGERELMVLLAHERAHPPCRHHWLRPLARAVAFTIERWADGPVPRRRLGLAIALVLGAIGLCTLEALRDLHDLLETAGV